MAWDGVVIDEMLCFSRVETSQRNTTCYSGSSKVLHTTGRARDGLTHSYRQTTNLYPGGFSVRHDSFKLPAYVSISPLGGLHSTLDLD